MQTWMSREGSAPGCALAAAAASSSVFSAPPRSLENVEAGHTELLRYYESISKHRGLILKLFGVMVAIVLIVGLVARR